MILCCYSNDAQDQNQNRQIHRGREREGARERESERGVRGGDTDMWRKRTSRDFCILSRM